MLIALAGLVTLGAIGGVFLVLTDRSRTSGGATVVVDPARSRRQRRVADVAALVALVWVVGAVLALFFVPMVSTQSVTAEVGSEEVVTSESHPLIDVGLPARILAVVVGVGVVAAAVRAGRPRRSVLCAIGVLSLVFVVLTGFSIGLLFLPVPPLLLLAGTVEP